MYEDFINALQNFRRNKMRTFLSLLGVIIGVASVIIITSIGASAADKITSTYTASGLDLVYVHSGSNPFSNTGIKFDESFRAKLQEGVQNIKAVHYVNNLNAGIRYEHTDINASVSAIELGYLEMVKSGLDYGRYFTETDHVQGSQKVVLGSEIAAVLFPAGNAVGKTVVMNMENTRFGFEVIGVLTKKDDGVESPNRSVYVTRDFYAKKITPNPAGASAVIQVTNQNLSPQVEKDVAAFATALTGTSNSIYAFSMTSILNQFNIVVGVVSLLLSGVAAISLLVGGIGIMNIMIVTVTERRKEIGIRKALGATQSDIRNQFLVESASITLLGGIIGIILGLGISFVADYILSWKFKVQVPAIILAFVFSAFVGVFFGLSPATRAAKLDPVEALASE